MNPMHAAIKQRLGKGAAPEHSAPAPSHEGAPGGHVQHDLHGFVGSLSDEEKAQLKSILHSDQGNTQSIAKGGPSTEEQSKIADAIAEENQENMLDAGQHGGGLSEDESDEIGKSMLDSRHLRGQATEKPKNLSERAKQYIAGKLKAKGKI